MKQKSINLVVSKNEDEPGTLVDFEDPESVKSISAMANLNLIKSQEWNLTESKMCGIVKDLTEGSKPVVFRELADAMLIH